MIYHPTLLQLLAQDAMRKQQDRVAQTHAAPARPAGAPSPVRHALASYLVRLGLHLDPAAGGGPGAAPRKEARRCA